MRRSAALIAAYALALQVILSGFASVAPFAFAADGSFALCRSGADTPAAPPSHETCGACLAHCAGAGTEPDRVAVLPAWPAGGIRIATAFPVPVAVTTDRARAHSPRAPPLG